LPVELLATTARANCRRPRFRSLASLPLKGLNAGEAGTEDFDHFGAGSVALQRMLVQEVRSRILLPPAWPADWDADFKLHLGRGTVLTGTVKDGRLTTWDIVPASRKRNVTVCQPQPAKPPTPPVPPGKG
jgi:hypothetical protein